MAKPLTPHQHAMNRIGQEPMTGLTWKKTDGTIINNGKIIKQGSMVVVRNGKVVGMKPAPEKPEIP